MFFKGRRGLPRLCSAGGCLGGGQGRLAWRGGTHWVQDDVVVVVVVAVFVVVIRLLFG